METTPAVTLPAEDFDYIVVGGGTAGVVCACRLSENPENRVLVLEAGGNQLANPMINIPAMWTAILGQEEVDWVFLTAPQVGGWYIQLQTEKLSFLFLSNVYVDE